MIRRRLAGRVRVQARCVCGPSGLRPDTDIHPILDSAAQPEDGTALAHEPFIGRLRCGGRTRRVRGGVLVKFIGRCTTFFRLLARLR